MSNMADRPSLIDGYLGPQLGFQELGLSTKSHVQSELETKENEFIIKLTGSRPVKLTTKVINCTTGKESQERVFTQVRGQDINILVSLDTVGYHKLQIYALDISEESRQLPGVFNYLILCKTMTRKARIFPKQYAKWNDGCTLLEPFSLAGLRGDVNFRVIARDARAVAVTISDNWTHLEPRDKGLWIGRLRGVEHYKGKGLNAFLNANFDDDNETKYVSLLQFAL